MEEPLNNDLNNLTPKEQLVLGMALEMSLQEELALILEGGAFQGIDDACLVNLGKLGLLLLMFCFFMCKWMTLISDFVNLAL